MQPGKIAYDRASIIFSPKGRLFQVEYARGAVDRGKTIIGLKYKEGVALIADKHISSSLVKSGSIEKIFQIDDHIGCSVSGLVADARKLVGRARLLAEINKVTYNEKIPVKTLVKQICEYKQVHTQFATYRPFGVALLIAGADNTGQYLFATQPSGAFIDYKATSEGLRSKEAVDFFEQNYEIDLSVEDAISLGVKALHKVTKGKFNLNAIEIAIVDTEKRFHKLLPNAWKKYIKEAFE
jgi:proteasome alpha subunit